MLDPAPSGTGVFLLDFQHAQFYKTPNPEILMFEAGYFARSLQDWVTEDTLREWCEMILTAIKIVDLLERERLLSRFYFYKNKTEFSRKERKKIR